MKPLIKTNSLHLHIRTIYFFSLLAIVVLGLPSYAVPINTPFLSVDIDGDSGDTAPGWSGWDLTDAVSSGTPVSNTFGSVTVTMTPDGYDTSNGGADTLDRGNPPEEPLQDSIYASRDTGIGLGQRLFTLEFSGLTANTPYEVTLLGYDQNYSDELGFMAFDTRDPYPSSSGNYMPATGGVNNPLYGDLLGRFPVTGTWPSNHADGIYHYSDSEFVTADGSGVITLYAWNDSESWATQLDSLLSGFELGLPEPATCLLLALGAICLRRKH